MALAVFTFWGGMSIVVLSKRNSPKLTREVCGEETEVNVEDYSCVLILHHM